MTVRAVFPTRVTVDADALGDGGLELERAVAAAAQRALARATSALAQIAPGAGEPVLHPPQIRWTGDGLAALSPEQLAELETRLVRALGGRTTASPRPRIVPAAHAPRRGVTPVMWSAPRDELPAAPELLVELHPERGTVRLLGETTVAQIAEGLYGAPRQWRELLVPYNRRLLADAGEATRLAAGTELRVHPPALTGEARMLFAAVGRAVEQARRTGAAGPYIHAQVDAPVVPGNEVRYVVAWPNTMFADARAEWWVEHDPYITSFTLVRPREQGPTETIGWVTKDPEDAGFRKTWTAVGTHKVRCRVTFRDGRVVELEHVQVVVAAPEQLELARPLLSGPRPQERPRMTPLRALYVSTGEEAATMPLTIYVAPDPDYSGVDPDYHLKLWDFTPGAAERTYTGSAERLQDAMADLLETFADDSPYPKGLIRFQVTSASLPYTGLLDREYTFPTDGGMLVDDLLQAGSAVALGVGVIVGLAGQAEIAVPAFAVSGMLGAAASGFQLADRLEHGDFQWDAQAVLNLMDVASALLTVGVSSAAATTVKGIGKVSLTARLNLALGAAQLAIIGAQHLQSIGDAVHSGNADRVLAALLNAARTGGLILVLHRAANPKLPAAAPVQMPSQPPKLAPPFKRAASTLEELERLARTDAEAGHQQNWYRSRGPDELRQLERGNDPIARELLNERFGGSKRPSAPDRPSGPAKQPRLDQDLRALRARVERAQREAEKSGDTGKLAPRPGTPEWGRTRSAPAGKVELVPTAKELGRYRGTVGVARTDIPALSERVFEGASPQAGGTRHPKGRIKSPASPKAPQGHAHAEEDLLNQLDDALQSLPPADRAQARGRTVSMRIDQEVCSTCAQGIKSGARAGVLLQFSRLHPDIVLEVAADDTSQVIRLLGGGPL